MAASGRVRFTGADGIDLVLTLVSEGRGSATPVLLLHGLSQQRAFWGPVMGRLGARPVAAVDQRGHGESDTPLTADFSVTACARDAIAALEHLGWQGAVVVGHSWGASVALAAAAARPDLVKAAVLLDGGLWSPSALGPREEVRERLTPPALGLPPEELWALIRRGDLGPSWSSEVQAALAPSFVTDQLGVLRSRLGRERHMRVLDGLLDLDASALFDATEAAGTPVWAVVCDGRRPAPRSDDLADGWQSVRESSAQAARERTNILVHRWAGAIHDVPLQWPTLVAAFIDTVVDSEIGGDA
ncbi:MAG: alpha/beta hydrolase [Actinobacteria bacterium]|nr:alpha/beta hydrolase [Actinomycetota bacterium]